MYQFRLCQSGYVYIFISVHIYTSTDAIDFCTESANLAREKKRSLKWKSKPSQPKYQPLSGSVVIREAHQKPIIEVHIEFEYQKTALAR